MKTIKHLALLVALCLISSCQKVVEFDIDNLENHVVLNGVPSVDSTMFVNVSYSRFFLDNSQYLPATGAQITLWVNGTPMSSNRYEKGNYFFPYTVTEGDSLRVEVLLDGRQPVSAATRVPHKPLVDSVMAILDTNQIIPTMAIHCRLHDPIGTNYYRFFVIERDSGERFNTWTQEIEHIDTLGTTYFSCTDPNLIDAEASATEALLGTFFGELMCKDVHFDGQDYNIDLGLISFRDTAEHEGFTRWYWLCIESLSVDYFNYRTSVSKANGMSSYFAEPEKLYTNVQNGLGILGGKARIKIPLTVTYATPQDETKHKHSQIDKSAAARLRACPPPQTDIR